MPPIASSLRRLILPRSADRVQVRLRGFARALLTFLWAPRFMIEKGRALST